MLGAECWVPGADCSCPSFTAETLYPLQVGIRRRVPEDPEHGHDLSLVVEGVRQHVHQYERRTAVRARPIAGILIEFYVEPILRELIEVTERLGGNLDP